MIYYYVEYEGDVIQCDRKTSNCTSVTIVSDATTYSQISCRFVSVSNIHIKSEHCFMLSVCSETDNDRPVLPVMPIEASDQRSPMNCGRTLCMSLYYERAA